MTAEQQGTSTGRIDAIAERFASRWRDCPPIHVVATAADLPFPAPADAEGAFRRGETYLVAGALDQHRAVEVIAHEVVGHHGLRRTLGSTWRSFLASTLAGTRRDPELRAARRHIEQIYAADGDTIALSPLRLADEIAATIAERSVDPSTGAMAVARPLQKQAAAVAGHVAREVLLMDRPVCADQLQGTVLLAERQLRVGGTFFGWRRRVAHWYAGFMAYKFDPNARPMSLQEAQDLLRAENTRLQTKEDNKVMAHLGLAALLFAVFGGSVILMIVRGLSS